METNQPKPAAPPEETEVTPAVSPVEIEDAELENTAGGRIVPLYAVPI